MQLRVSEMDQIEKDPSEGARRNIIISPEEAEPAPVVVVEEEGLSPAEERERELNALLAADENIADEELEDIEDDMLGEDEFGNEEISALSGQLDQLQSALDEIESRNDNIHKQLLEILHSNREVRQTLSAENQMDGNEPNPSSIADSVNSEMGAEAIDKINNDANALFKLVDSVTDKIDKL